MTNQQASKSRRRAWPFFLLVGLAAVGLACYVSAPACLSHLSSEKITRHLAVPLLRLVFYLGLGLLVGQAIETLGWASKLGAWVSPVLRWGHLRPESGATFTAAFFSGILANTMLITLYQEERITREELVLTYLVNSGLPVYLLHLPTTFFVILPLTRRAGLIYLCLTGLAALLKSLAVLFYTRLRLPAPELQPASAASSRPAEKKQVLAEILEKFKRRFVRVVVYTIPIYLLIFLANEGGLFTYLRQAAAQLVSVRFFPVEAASVVIFAVAAEFTSGMAAAGALLDAGRLSVPQVVVALILGTIVATPIRALRHQLPSHMGIFAPRLGTELLLLSQILRIFCIVLVSAGYVWWTLG